MRVGLDIQAAGKKINQPRGGGVALGKEGRAVLFLLFFVAVPVISGKRRGMASCCY